ncbi:sensor histidine kinase [Faecalispora jeddahensis]|uniref:sensor histidine kinase n=1 Tax=Faecalispora jeddahensis TaxID=1414721 RepID=UPI0027BA9AE1|nr:sensor histidine kinase [Faecalispora jeddahensis]
MRRRPIFDIERKILLPFLLLGIVSTAIFGVILYDTSRSTKLAKERNLAENNISLIEFDIDYSVRMGQVQQLREKYRELPQFHILIEDRDGAFIGGTPVGTGEVLYSSSDNRLGWKISYTVDPQVFTTELLHEQKYTVLAIIAQLILVLQASILIADNISTPIRRLSYACRTVSEQPQEPWDVDVEFTKRGDELGQLARAFQGMLRNLQRYTADLRREKNLNQTIVESLPLAVIAYDQDQNILLSNSRAQNLLAKTEYRHEGKPLSALLEECLENQKVFYDPIQLTDEENHRLDVELGVWRLMDENQKSWGVLCTVDDITYRKLMEEQAVQDEKLIYTGKLAAELAHEIRNPLAGIRVGVQVVERHVTQENDRVLCETIVGEVDRINLLVENLCSLGRKRELKKDLIPVDELFGEILLLYSKIAENSHIHLRCEVPKDVLLYADKSAMKQVLINLINNSIKAMKSGGEILMKADVQEDCVCLWIIDDGPGIAAERLGEGNRDGGMGLSIVSQLLRQNDAAFQIKSAPGQGTKARITFRR